MSYYKDPYKPNSMMQCHWWVLITAHVDISRMLASFTLIHVRRWFRRSTPLQLHIDTENDGLEHAFPSQYGVILCIYV